MDATRNCAPITSIVDCFTDIEDPRVVERTLHKLIDIVVVTICAVISGANTWKAVEAFGYAKYEWLGNFLELPNGYHRIRLLVEFLIEFGRSLS